MHYLGHRKRLRAKLKSAPEELSNYEILELMLGYVLLRADTKPIAKELLDRFSTLRGVMQARQAELTDITGIGPGVADFFFLLQEFLARYAESDIRTRQKLCTPKAVAAMARERLGKLGHEEVWAAFVNNGNLLIAWERVATGSVGGSILNPRDIMERSLLLKATGFILVHNHPGGDPNPSAADADVTRRIEIAARALDLRFLDHVIVTEKNCYSMMGAGLLP